MGARAGQQTLHVELRGGHFAITENHPLAVGGQIRRHQRAARQLPAAEQVAGLHHVVEGATQGGKTVIAQSGEQTLRRVDVIREGFRKTRPHTVEPRVIVVLERGGNLTDLGLHGLHGGANVATELAIQQVRGLDAIGALIDRGNAHVPQILRGTGFLNVAHAAVYLHPQRGDLHTQLSEPAFDHRDHQINTALTRLAGPREASQRRIDLMIPVIKGWLTELGMEVTSLGVQVHGGMGYVEETGAAQYLRDVRITPIYEGTNGIQAADLLNRKLGRDVGATMEAMQAEIREVAATLQDHNDPRLHSMGSRLAESLADHVDTTQRLLATLSDDRFAALGGSFDYMMQTGYLFGGWQLARGALVAANLSANGERVVFCDRKVTTAQFYMERLLPRARAHAGAIDASGESLSAFSYDWF